MRRRNFPARYAEPWVVTVIDTSAPAWEIPTAKPTDKPRSAGRSERAGRNDA